MDMAKISRELVLGKLAEVFADPVVAENALRTLDRLANLADAPAVELVQLAILRLCGGELWRLRDLVKAARDDFEDVVSLAREPERYAYLHQKLSRRKALTAAERTEMQRRDQRQWVEWLKG
jgi:hypothetical protein